MVIYFYRATTKQSHCTSEVKGSNLHLAFCVSSSIARAVDNLKGITLIYGMHSSFSLVLHKGQCVFASMRLILAVESEADGVCLDAVELHLILSERTPQIQRQISAAQVIRPLGSSRHCVYLPQDGYVIAFSNLFHMLNYLNSAYHTPSK